jgi:hypothetical protein
VKFGPDSPFSAAIPSIACMEKSESVRNKDSNFMASAVELHSIIHGYDSSDRIELIVLAKARLRAIVIFLH